MRMDLAYVPLNEASWQEFVSWWKDRGLDAPPIPSKALFVMSERGYLCGVCLDETQGAYVLVTSLATNFAAPIKHRKAAINLLIRGLRVYAVVVGKVLVCAPMGRSLMRLAKKHGFNAGPTMLMQYSPVWVIPGAYKERGKREPIVLAEAPSATKPVVHVARAKPARKKGKRR
jgi:hypothetical protein